MKTRNFITVPETGGLQVASQTVTTRKDPPKSMTDVPVGEGVAKVFPWYSGLKQTVSGVLNAETRIVRDGIGSAAFINNTNREVLIHELRFFASVPTSHVDGGLPTNLMINNRMGVKIRHSDYEVVSEWLPVGMLNTHNNRASAAARNNLVTTLPTPYYLQAGHPFRLRMRSTNPFQVAEDYTLWVTLLGKDPRTNKPYEICKEVTFPYISGVLPSDANPQYVDVLFDDGRDYPMRDMLLTHVLFSFSLPFGGSTNRSRTYRYANQLDVQFMAPEGPKWQDMFDWMVVGNLVDQSTTPGDYSIVIYRPQVPMKFLPSQQIDIDVKTLFPMFWLNGEVTTFTAPLWVSLIGTQRAQAGE